MTESRSIHVPRLVAIIAWSMIASSLAWGNLWPSGSVVLGTGGMTADDDWYLDDYGWPARYRLRWTIVTTTGMIDLQGRRIGPQSTSASDFWCVSGLIVDVAVALLMLTSTALIVRKWLGGTRLTQLSLKTVMIMIAVVATLMTFYRASDDLDAMMLQGTYLWAVPLYLKIPFSIGLGCVAFVAISSGFIAMGHLLHICRQGQRCDNSVAGSSIADPDAENKLDSRRVQLDSNKAYRNLDASDELNRR
jgi:hypothetical protein